MAAFIMLIRLLCTLRKLAPLYHIHKNTPTQHTPLSSTSECKFGVLSPWSPPPVRGWILFILWYLDQMVSSVRAFLLRSCWPAQLGHPPSHPAALAGPHFPAREYWMIYRGSGFLAVGWFGSSNLHPPPVSKLYFFLSLPVCHWSSLRTGEGGGGRGGAKSYDSVKAWSSMINSVLSDSHPHTCTPGVASSTA